MNAVVQRPEKGQLPSSQLQQAAEFASRGAGNQAQVLCNSAQALGNPVLADYRLFQFAWLCWSQSITKGSQLDSRQEPEQTMEKHCSLACSASIPQNSEPPAQAWHHTVDWILLQQSLIKKMPPDSSTGRFLAAFSQLKFSLPKQSWLVPSWEKKNNQQRQDPATYPGRTQTLTQVAPHTFM